MVINNDDFGVATDKNKISRDVLDLPAQWRVDLGVNYQIFDSTSIQFNVSNLFDELPPIVAVVSGDENIYDNRGRYYRLGLNVNF
ncbi:hypothetical protein PALB_8990 [Pseudoalteromonas luteoviolacea B = ATCC 29581]|nr:hypothetical protein PALB_8990 [Pseudoalteromonas luteoviolacea B = ATCC 29581]